MKLNFCTLFKEALSFIAGNDEAMSIMSSVVNLLKPINATILKKGGGGEDISLWMAAGVPGGSLKNANENYFYFHHTNGN